MPVSEKKSTISTVGSQTGEQTVPKLPDQQTFYQHLRQQIRSAVQAVMEEVMREELSQFLTRGVKEVDLMVTDGHDGLLAALSDLFPSTLRQRCVVHKQRNIMNAIPRWEHKQIAGELAGIWKAASKGEALTNLSAFKGKYQKRYPEAVRSLCDDEEHLLTFYAFPQVMHRYIRTTNAIESFFSNVRQRTDTIDTFPTETSCLSIVWAVMQDIRLPKIPVG